MASRRNRLLAVVAAGLLLTAACTGAKPARDAALTTDDGSDVATIDGVDPGTEVAVEPGADQGGPTGTVTPGGPARPGGTAGRAGTKGAAPASSAADNPPLPTPPGFVPTSLFKANEDRIGLTDTTITMCAHAALTYAPAFNTGPDDLNVYWSALNDAGGVHGRKVQVTYENDDYKPDPAVTAARACAAKGIFMLLGGIGFDQIPAVRNWAEQNRMLYLHHTATVNGSEGKQFSWTALPTTERMGEMFGKVALAKYRGKKIGIIERASDNWSPGVAAFKKVVGNQVEIVGDKKVQNGQSYYAQELLDLKTAGAEIVWLWENALASTEIIKQAKAQNWHPTFMAFPFNLTSQSLGDDALNPKMVGVAMFAAYSFKDYSGSFAAYADDMKQFEAQYAKYRPNVDLSGVAGDLLFLNWQAQKSMHKLLELCGRDCGRNKFIDVMRTYKGRPTSSACDINFPEGSHVGTDQVNVMETYRAPGGQVNWRNTNTCVSGL